MLTQVMQKRLFNLLSVSKGAAYFTNHELHFTLIHFQLIVKAEQSKYHYHHIYCHLIKNTYIQVSTLMSILHKI